MQPGSGCLRLVREHMFCSEAISVLPPASCSTSVPTPDWHDNLPPLSTSWFSEIIWIQLHFVGCLQRLTMFVRINCATHMIDRYSMAAG